MPRWIAIACVAAGCAHVELTVPPPDASAVERVAAYRAMHAVEHGATLTLANGREVGDPHAILPVVPADSAAARAVHRGDRAWRRGMIWGASGLAAGGLAMLARWAADRDGHGELGAGFEIGADVALVVGGGMASWSWYDEARADRDAFAAYDDGLRAELRVCVDGLQVVACDSPPARAAR